MNESQSPRFTKEQKTGMGLLLIFAFLVVGLGALQLRNTLYNPFAISKVSVEDDPFKGLVADEQVRLQSIDTDQDGLHDYEELQFHETSPYLPDTDSDGIGDKQEIEAGSDPRCPKNEVCEEQVGMIPQPSTSTALQAPVPTAPSTDLLDLIGGGSVTTTGSDTPLNIADVIDKPDQLRQLLKQTGAIPEADLAKIDDQTLMSIAKELFLGQVQPE